MTVNWQKFHLVLAAILIIMGSNDVLAQSRLKQYPYFKQRNFYWVDANVIYMGPIENAPLHMGIGYERTRKNKATRFGFSLQYETGISSSSDLMDPDSYYVNDTKLYSLLHYWKWQKYLFKGRLGFGVMTGLGLTLEEYTKVRGIGAGSIYCHGYKFPDVAFRNSFFINSGNLIPHLSLECFTGIAVNSGGIAGIELFGVRVLFY
ncbi:MAG: hypothetical protein GC180_04515 [Bacteroidetes bacterium]|nr:hypothetical protein [Bacteroidota bacterium]